MKKFLTLLMVVVVIVTLSGCGTEDESDTIKIGFLPSLTAVPYIYALEEGYYDEYGIDVEIKHSEEESYIFRSAKARDMALTSKKDGINAVSSDLVMLILNNESGIDMQFTVETQEIFTMVSQPGKNYNSLDDTDGKKFGVSEMTVIEFLADKIADNHSISYNKEAIPVVPNRFASLKSGAIDLAIMPEPFPTKIIVDGDEDGNKGKKVWSNLYDQDDISDDYYVTALGFKKDFIEKNPDVVSDFHKATNEAIRDLKEKDISEYKQYIIDYGILDSVYLDENSDRFVGKPVFKELVAPNEDVFDDALKWLNENNYIESEYNYNDLYYDGWNQ